MAHAHSDLQYRTPGPQVSVSRTSQKRSRLRSANPFNPKFLVRVGLISAILRLAMASADLLLAQTPPQLRRDQASHFFVSPDSCTPGSIPLTMRDGIALARLTINHKPMTFIVDSAGTTMVNSDRVTLPVVRELRAAPVTISASESPESWRVVSISSLGLGKKQIHDLNVLSRSLPQLEAKLKVEIDGILGADMLMWWDFVALDYQHKVLVLESSACTNPK
jgi:hypothetical protein